MPQIYERKVFNILLFILIQKNLVVFAKHMLNGIGFGKWKENKRR